MNNIGLTACQVLDHYGYEGFVVGGAVRDNLLGLKSDDIDIATNAGPDRIEEMFREQNCKTFDVGKKFGTIGVIINNQKVEITTYRIESDYKDGRHPSKIVFQPSLIQDLARRDFRINAIAFNPLTHGFVDPFNGRSDIDKRVIRCVGNPVDRFTEDPLRMLRMSRFVSKLGFMTEAYDSFIIEKHGKLIHKVSKERIREELLKLLGGKYVLNGLAHLSSYGLLKEILPELHKVMKVKQPHQYHLHTVGKHCMSTVDYLPQDNPLLRFAGLIHDVGKLKANKESPYFPIHELKSMRLAYKIMKRLKFSNKDTDYVTFLVGHHMDIFHMQKITHRSMRRYLNRNEEYINYMHDLADFVKADLYGSGVAKDRTLSRIGMFKFMFYQVLDDRKNKPFSAKDLAVNGHDIMTLGVKGEVVGKILNQLVFEVIKDPRLNTKKELMARAQFTLDCLENP